MNRYPIVMPILFAISTACALPAAGATVASVTFNYGGFGTVTDLGDNAYVSRSEGTENGSGSGTATAVAGLGALKAAAESEYKINATGTTRSIVSFSAVYLAGTSGFDDPVLDFFVNLDGSVTGNYAPGVNSNQWRVRGTLSVGYTSPVTGLAVSTSATPVDLQGRAGNQSIAGSLGLSVTVAAGTKVQVSGKLDIWIDGQAFTLSEGDSFRIRGQAYRWSNPYARPAVAVWVISPPVY